MNFQNKQEYIEHALARPLIALIETNAGHALSAESKTAVAEALRSAATVGAVAERTRTLGMIRENGDLYRRIVEQGVPAVLGYPNE